MKCAAGQVKKREKRQEGTLFPLDTRDKRGERRGGEGRLKDQPNSFRKTEKGPFGMGETEDFSAEKREETEFGQQTISPPLSLSLLRLWGVGRRGPPPPPPPLSSSSSSLWSLL